MKKKRQSILAVVMAVFSLIACTAIPAFASGDTFVYARAASVTSLNLYTEITENNAFAIDNIFEPLVLFDREGVVDDWLAASHTISEDGLVYTFVLRDGLKFSDGTDVTAEDAAFSLNRHLEEKGPLPLEADIASITAKDEKTLVITLNEAYTPFFSELANFSNGILPKDFGGKTEEEFFEAPVGTGPYALEKWDPAGDISFVRNEYYWQGTPAVERLVYKFVDDDNQAINQLKAGEVDAVESVAYANAAEIENGAETSVIVTGSWNVEEVFFNTLDEHFADVHVRRALAMALDREALTQALTFGYGEKADSVLPSSLRYSTSDTIKALGADVDAAREELALSAFPDGFETTISIASGNNTRLQEAQIIQAAGASIGIDIGINTQEIAAFREDFKSLNYSIMINTAVADFPDADSIFAFQVDPEGFSQCYWTNYKNDDAVELLKAGQVTPDGEARAGVYADLQQILADEVPYIPLYYIGKVTGIRSNVEGLTVLPNGSARFEKVSFS